MRVVGGQVGWFDRSRTEVVATTARRSRATGAANEGESLDAHGLFVPNLVGRSGRGSLRETAQGPGADDDVARWGRAEP